MNKKDNVDFLKVAPFTGAWIEIIIIKLIRDIFNVAPFTGAWIEIIVYPKAVSLKYRRSLHGSVD